MVLAACTTGSSSASEDSGTDAEAASLTSDGASRLGDDLSDAPAYDLEVAVDPGNGRVDGTVRADLPVEEAGVIHLRYFPALVDPDATVTDVEVGGDPADFDLDTSLLTVPAGEVVDGRVQISATFTFTVPEIPETGGLDSLDGMLGDEALQPASTGLIGRQGGVVNLGHWFPIWIPEGLSAEPTPAGFGDVGNFPAAVLEVEIDEPSGWTVVTGGVRQRQDGSRVVESGSGLRDLALVLVEDAVTVAATTGDTTVRVIAPGSGATTDEVLDGALDEAVTALEVLSDAFGPYPWAELDVAATPLGSGVGGMEFPGLVWIESTIFAGSLPGLGDLDVGELDLGEADLRELDLGQLDLDGLDLGELDDLEEIFDGELEDLLTDGFDSHFPDGEEDPGFGDLLDELSALDFGELDLGELDGLDLGAALDPEVLGSTRAWVIAHEVAHQWWHALVGNDSITAPVVDEPLAQYSSCLVFREARPATAGKVCEANLAGTYEEMRLFGVEDAPADRPSDDFDSTLQYGGVIYGKAPLLYETLAETFGEDAVVAALAAVVDDYAFEQASTPDLRATLGEELGDAPTVDLLWERWLEGAYGDEDVLGR